LHLFLRSGVIGPRPTPELEDHPFSAIRICLFTLLASTYTPPPYWRRLLHLHPEDAPCGLRLANFAQSRF